MGFLGIINLQRKASSSSSILASILLILECGKFHKSSINWGYFEPPKHKKKSRRKSALRCYKALCYLGFAYALKYLLRCPSRALPRGASSRLPYVRPASKGLACKALWLCEFAYELMKSGSFHKNLSKGYFMTKTSSSVYQLPNGMWGYRYAYMFPKFDSMSQHIAEHGYLRYPRSVQSLSRSRSTIMEATQRDPASLWWVVSGTCTPFSFVDSE